MKSQLDLKGERYKARFTRDKPGNRMFGGWCAGEVLWSDSSVEVGAGDPCGCKVTGVIDESDTMEAPESAHTEIRGSPCRKVGGSIGKQPPAPVHTAGITNWNRNWADGKPWHSCHHRDMDDLHAWSVRWMAANSFEEIRKEGEVS